MKAKENTTEWEMGGKDQLYLLLASFGKLNSKECIQVKELVSELLSVKDADLERAIERIADLEHEVERLDKRDGNASIELCYDDGEHPFRRIALTVVDFGVADNVYVVTNDVIEKYLNSEKKDE